MARPLSEQVIVVTGASSGIGRCTALYLAGRGARVVLTARRAEALAQLAREIEARGGQALAVPGDVTREDDLRAVARAAVEHFGRIDTWINNAGVFIQGRVQDVTLEEYRRVLDVNLVGLINGTRCALDVMRAQGAGTIVQVSSVMGKRGTPYFGAYAAAKAGVDGFCEALRAELWGTGIRVTTVYPPNVDTPIYHRARGKFGTVPRPSLPVVDPVVAARAIAAAVARPRPERVFGGFGRLYVALARLLPVRWVDALLHRTESLGLSELPAGGDNLDRPVDDAPRARGGWAERGWRGLTWRDAARGVPWEVLVGTVALGGVCGGGARWVARHVGVAITSRNGGHMFGTKKHSHIGWGSRVAAGAVAGAIGVWAMDRLGWWLWNREDDRALEREREARVEGMDPAHVFANRVARAVGTTLEPAQPHPAGIAVHYAIGMAPAMLYSAYRHRFNGLGLGRGLLYGLGVFLLIDEGLNLVLRLAGRPGRYPWQAHARGLTTHLVLGAVTDRTLAVLDRAVDARRGRSGVWSSIVA